MKYYAFVLTLVTFFTGCSKDEKLISGDVTGSIALIDHTYSLLPPQSGLKVNLYLDSHNIDSTLTDDNGYYLFENLPYGRYDIRCSREGFVKPWDQPSIFHVGGYSPTIFNFELSEIPDYQLQLTRVDYYAGFDDFIIALEIDGDTILEGNSWSYFFRAFLSNSPNVSKDSYTIATKGFITDLRLYNSDKVAAYGIINKFDINGYEAIIAAPVYIILYPIANNQGFIATDFFPEALGPASNVISFDWN
jgi:hypothetical protein